MKLTHAHTSSTTSMVGNYTHDPMPHPLSVKSTTYFLLLQKEPVVETDSVGVKPEYVRKAFIKREEVSC